MFSIFKSKKDKITEAITDANCLFKGLDHLGCAIALISYKQTCTYSINLGEHAVTPMNIENVMVKYLKNPYALPPEMAKEVVILFERQIVNILKRLNNTNETHALYLSMVVSSFTLTMHIGHSILFPTTKYLVRDIFETISRGQHDLDEGLNHICTVIEMLVSNGNLAPDACKVLREEYITAKSDIVRELQDGTFYPEGLKPYREPSKEGDTLKSLSFKSADDALEYALKFLYTDLKQGHVYLAKIEEKAPPELVQGGLEAYFISIPVENKIEHKVMRRHHQCTDQFKKGDLVLVAFDNDLFFGLFKAEPELDLTISEWKKAS